MDEHIELEAQIRCVLREVAMRGNVYKKRIASGQMRREEAVKEYRAMQAVAESLQSIERQKQGWLELVKRSGLELSICVRCGCEVIVLPEGRPLCQTCCELENQ